MTVPVAGDTAVPSPEWDLEVRPRTTVRRVWAVAVFIVVVFTIGGVWLRTGSTGVYFQVADQFAMIGIGLIIGGGVLLLTRPRLRVGAAGVAVRNVLGETVFPWSYARGVTFPDRKAWARLELADGDYVPLMAIRANDKQRAADAIARLRELGARYAPEPDED